MCGIAGTNLKGSLEKRSGDLFKALRHRGPDHFGSVQKGPWQLFSARLKIQDLESGDQPFISPDGRYALIYNGELYNKEDVKAALEPRQWQTASDTEVVFWAFIEKGVEALEVFNGMFALAFYDSVQNELILARDRFGVKPLHYFQSKDGLSFASEIKSLLPLMPKPQLNLDGVKSYLQTNYVHDGTSIFKDVHSLRPGHFLKLKGSAKSIQQYWDLPSPDPEKKVDLDRVRELLSQAARRQLIGDRKVGVFLSSGIDSATMAYHASRKLSDIKAYNVSFADKEFDESSQAKTVADHLGIEFKKHIFSPAIFKESFPAYVAANSQPIADLGMYPLYSLSQYASETSTILLSGDGGDEIFCGYPTMKADTLTKYFKAPIQAGACLSPVLRGILKRFNSKSSWDYRLEKLLQGAALPPAQRHFHWRTVFTENELLDLGFNQGFQVSKEYEQHSGQAPGLEGFLRADFKVWLVCNNFLKTDISSMAHSIEARVPFLDNDLVQEMFSLPVREKWDFFSNKKLLRNAMAGRLPDPVVNGTKAAFHPPYVNWFKNELGDFARKNFKNSNLTQTLGLKEESLLAILDEHKSNGANNAYKIYNLLFLEFWLRAWT